MPITKSAKKAIRVDERKRVFNLRRKKNIENAVHELKKLVKSKDAKLAKEALSKAYKAIDKAAKEKTIKKNTAGRKKARLAALAKKAN